VGEQDGSEIPVGKEGGEVQIKRQKLTIRNDGGRLVVPGTEYISEPEFFFSRAGLKRRRRGTSRLRFRNCG
jgi:hypothetical protein